MRNWWKKGIKISVSIFFIVGLFYWLGIKNIFMKFSAIQPVWLSLFLATILFIFFCGAFNLWILLNRFAKIRFSNFLSQYIYSYILGLFSPGQVGDASLVIFFKKKFNVPARTSAAAYLIDKLITIFVFVCAASVGSFLYLPYKNEILLILGLVFLLIILFLYVNIRFFSRSEFNSKILAKLKIFWTELSLFKKNYGLILTNLALTIIKWAVMGAGYFFVFKALGWQMPIVACFFIPAMTVFISYLPVSVGGIGTVEVVAVYLFSLAGADKIVVLDGYFLSRLCIYFSSFLIFVIMYFKKNSLEKRVAREFVKEA